MKTTLPIILVIALLSTSCASLATTHEKAPLQLAEFTENSVKVQIQLYDNPSGEYFLSATFTPADGYHLYSKDIPPSGIEGLGRPTLLELSTDSHLEALGTLMESVQSQEPDLEPKELRVYPPGPVTLSLPVELPPGKEWIDDAVKVTFMGCSGTGCRPPVMGKVIPIRIPEADAPR